jgi:hypothetical protein
MSILSPDKIFSKCFLPLSVDFPPGRRPDLQKAGRGIYEVLTNTGRHGYKQRMRKRTFKTEPEQKYAPSESEAIRNVSYDAALRLTRRKEGVADFGTPTPRNLRGKKKLRISGKNPSAFLRSRVRACFAGIEFWREATVNIVCLAFLIHFQNY